MTQKIHLDSQQLLDDSFRLAAEVVASGYRPTLVVALWRGGVPIGVALLEFLRACGIEAQHCAIRTSYYTGIGQRAASVAIDGLDELVERGNAADRVLLVDDVFDTGNTMHTLIGEWRRRAGTKVPGEMRIAVPWYKPRFNRTDRAPDYYLHETEAWLVYPHSLEGMDDAEIARHRPGLAAILSEAAKDRS